MRLNYRVIGNGKDIVLLHGWGMSSKVWEVVIGRMAKKFRVTMVDFPGYGLNKNFDSEYTLSRISEQIAEIMPKNSILLGWSMGGLFAIWLAVHYPCLVSKLIITNGTPCFVEKDTGLGLA